MMLLSVGGTYSSGYCPGFAPDSLLRFRAEATFDATKLRIFIHSAKFLAKNRSLLLRRAISFYLPYSKSQRRQISKKKLT